MPSINFLPNYNVVPTIEKLKPIWYILFLLPILIYVWIIYQYTLNIPYIDDFTFLVDGLYWKSITLTPNNIARHLFAPHGEHIILFARLCTLIDFLVEGEINFRTLYFIGNTTLIGTVYLFYYSIKDIKSSILYLIPVTLLIFQPQYYENTITWTICALQHIPSLFFAFLSFILINQKSTKFFLLSFLTAFISVFSNGNGPIVLIISLLLIVIKQDKIKFIGWTFFSVFVGMLYAYIHHIYRSPDVDSNLLHPLRVLAGFFVLTGAPSLLFTQSILIIAFWGVCFLVMMGIVITTELLKYTEFFKTPSWLNKRLRLLTNPLIENNSLVLVMLFLYFIFTLIGISFARSLGWYQSLLLPRFIGFTTILYASSYLITLLWLKPYYRQIFTLIMIIISFSLNILSYRRYIPEVLAIQNSQISDLYNWRVNKILTSLPANNSQFDDYYSNILQLSIMKNIYTFPHIPFEFVKNLPTTKNCLISSDSTFSLGNRLIHSLSMNSESLSLSKSNEQQLLLELKSDKSTFVLSVNSSTCKTSLILLTGQVHWPAHIVWLFSNQVPAGVYKTSLIWSQNGQWLRLPSTQRITLH